MAKVEPVVANERRLLAELGTIALVSAWAGGALWRAGRRENAPGVARFGRQTAAWAAVDLGIVGWGARGLRRPVADAEDGRKRARRMAVITGVNAVLDVGYVGGGAFLLTRPKWRWDGAAVVLQGAALLWLDVRHARRFRRVSTS